MKTYTLKLHTAQGNLSDTVTVSGHNVKNAMRSYFLAHKSKGQMHIHARGKKYLVQKIPGKALPKISIN